jgi:putative transposase
MIIDTMNIINTISNENDVSILSLDVQSNYIHIKVSIHPKTCVHDFIASLKQSLASQLKKNYPSLKTRVSNLFTRNYFITTKDELEEKVLNDFIETQKSV